MPIIFNGHRGELLKTAQQIIYHTGDDGDMQGGLTRPTYTVYSAGSPYTGTSNIDLPHYCNNTISFSVGKRQVETATVVATITQAGYGIFTVTAANSANLAAGKAINVTVDTNINQPFPIGSVVTIEKYGAGNVKISPAGTVTINSANSGNTINFQYSAASLVKTDTNIWWLGGDLIIS